MSETGDAAAWEKLRRLAEKHRASEDPDISKALEAALVAEAQDLAGRATSKPGWLADFPLVAGFFSTLPTAPVQADPSDPSDHTDLPTAPPEGLPNDVETAERLIREAHLFTMRGDKAKAKEILDQAEKAAPRSGAVLVALSEAALERHNVKEAIRLLTIAKEANPGNVAIEKKHADAVFRQTQGMIFDPTSKSNNFENVASAKAAVILSMMLPGLGQIVTGDVGKGAGILAAWAGAWIVALLIGFKGFFAMIGMGSPKDADGLVLIPLGIAIILHLYGLLDAAGKAKTIEKRKIVRPVPPTNLPFE